MGAHSRHVRGSQKQGSRNKKKAAARDKRAADAAAAKQQAAAEAEDDVEEPEDDSDGEQPTRVHDEAQEERRRQAIVYKFEELGAPPEEQWSGPGGTLAEIRKWLGLHCDADVRPIKQVLQRHVAGESLRKPNSGRRQKLSHGEALVAADCMERGKGRAQAAYIVTARREEQGRSKVSEKAVRTAFRTLGGVTQRRGTDDIQVSRTAPKPRTVSAHISVSDPDNIGSSCSAWGLIVTTAHRPLGTIWAVPCKLRSELQCSYEKSTEPPFTATPT